MEQVSPGSAAVSLSGSHGVCRAGERLLSASPALIPAASRRTSLTIGPSQN